MVERCRYRLAKGERNGARDKLVVYKRYTWCYVDVLIYNKGNVDRIANKVKRNNVVRTFSIKPYTVIGCDFITVIVTIVNQAIILKLNRNKLICGAILRYTVKGNNRRSLIDD